MKDAMHEAGDKLAEAVSTYLETRATLAELSEAAIAYYQAHEKRIFEKDVGALVERTMTFQEWVDEVAGATKLPVGLREHGAEYVAPAPVDPNAAIHAHYEGASVPKGMHAVIPGKRDSWGASWANDGYSDLKRSDFVQPPSEFIEMPMRPVHHPLAPFPIPAGYTDELRDGVYLKVDMGEFIIYGTARAPTPNGCWECIPIMQTDRNGVVMQTARYPEPLPLAQSTIASKVGKLVEFRMTNPLKLDANTAIKGVLTVTINEQEMIFRGAIE